MAKIYILEYGNVDQPNAFVDAYKHYDDAVEAAKKGMSHTKDWYVAPTLTRLDDPCVKHNGDDSATITNTVEWFTVRPTDLVGA